jgi:hypothetical protein
VADADGGLSGNPNHLGAAAERAFGKYAGALYAVKFLYENRVNPGPSFSAARPISDFHPWNLRSPILPFSTSSWSFADSFPQ